MASAFMQGVGATTALSSANYKNSCFAFSQIAPRFSIPVFLSLFMHVVIACLVIAVPLFFCRVFVEPFLLLLYQFRLVVVDSTTLPLVGSGPTRFQERKGSFFVIRSDGSVNSGLNPRIGRRGTLSINAVATKQDNVTSSTASKPGDYVNPFKTLSPFSGTSFCSLKLSVKVGGRDGQRSTCLCEDVGHYGGSYKVTKGLATKFGDLRVLDTPIAENSFTGMAIGAAMTGLRPIVEGMNMGFLLLAFNQISNNCGMLHYTSGGQFKIPVVIRGPGGVGRQLGAEHSQRLESYFQSIPGIQMVACSTPYNAKGLMKAAIRREPRDPL
ncbi:Pyruvate dehydrogenase E1 component subunit beta-3, chloroplastic [Sesamum angolense]|uniref:pyruvate dehydrogenase (acetyl-transferring) n=1 Tax=Sesamum angolense TaxID=2727404 RepID=A0AAE2BVI4_9LAMI|nr:Pyruvate dehydrogenase E1 component subunit beta-3, chloroplastic [Sesamum angolense]